MFLIEEQLIYLPQAWTKTPIGKIDGQRQCTNEHTEASARAKQQLRSKVPSSTGTLGAATDKWEDDDWEPPDYEGSYN